MVEKSENSTTMDDNENYLEVRKSLSILELVQNYVFFSTAAACKSLLSWMNKRWNYLSTWNVKQWISYFVQAQPLRNGRSAYDWQVFLCVHAWDKCWLLEYVGLENKDVLMKVIESEWDSVKNVDIKLWNSFTRATNQQELFWLLIDKLEFGFVTNRVSLAYGSNTIYKS